MGGLESHNRVKPTLLVKVELGFDNFLFFIHPCDERSNRIMSHTLSRLDCCRSVLSYLGHILDPKEGEGDFSQDS